MSRGKRIRRKREKTVASLETGLSRMMAARAYAADGVTKLAAKIELRKDRIKLLDGKIAEQEDEIRKVKADKEVTA